MEREMLISSPCYPLIGLIGMAQKCISEVLDQTLGRGCSNIGTGFLERQSMFPACQCLRDG